MEKVRRKVADEMGERKMRSLWKCRCKIGTTNATVAYFFDKPEVGVSTRLVREEELSGYKSTSVHIDDVYEGGFVFCSLM